MNSKKIIISIIIVVIIIGIIILLIYNNNNKKNNLNININKSSSNEVNNNNLSTGEEYDKYDVFQSRERAFKESNSSNKKNTLNMPATTEEAIMKAYLDEYIYNVLNFPEDAYNSLDKEYREKKFDNIEEYKEYINNNKETIQTTVLKKYAKYDRTNYKEYMLVDNYNKYYVFYISSPGSYKLYLDTYTVDIPEFKEKYEKATDKEKVILNAGKIIAAINNQDYKYVYSKLAEAFKQNKINSEDALKEILQEKIYNKNEIKVDEVEREGNIYTCQARIIKKYEEGEEVPEGKNAPSKNLNIVMQLKEGSDFVISFSVKD